jgi:hypothetical protein
LSSDPNVLRQRLKILIANLRLKHTNVNYNEVHAIADELLRQKKIPLTTYEQIITDKWQKTRLT